METQDGLPPEFDVCLERWRQADQAVRVALWRYRAAPNVVTRLGVNMAWAAINATLDELGGWGVLFRHTRASQASEDAHAIWGGLREEISKVGLWDRANGQGGRA